MDDRHLEQLFSNGQLALIIVGIMIVAFLYLFAQQKYELWRFRRCFAKHFPEINPGKCKCIIKENRHSLGRMNALRPHCDFSNPKSLKATLTSETPEAYVESLPQTKAEVALAILRVPHDVIRLAEPARVNTGREEAFAKLVRESVRGLRSSLANHDDLNSNAFLVVSRFHSVWLEWLKLRALPSCVHTAIRQEFLRR